MWLDADKRKNGYRKSVKLAIMCLITRGIGKTIKGSSLSYGLSKSSERKILKDF